LQSKNITKNITPKEAQEQGFVTVQHDIDILSTMNHPHAHIIAKKNDEVVGYALVMLPEFGNDIPVLRPMFEKIDTLHFKNKPLKGTNYFVMGQICVDKMCRRLITEVATRNVRSMNAHQYVGFEVVDVYTAAEEEWAIVAWDWEMMNEK